MSSEDSLATGTPSSTWKRDQWSGSGRSSTPFGALAYLAARSIQEWKNKSAALAALSTLALAIGISRLYLGVHWASDVGAGFAAGLLWVTATTTGYELFRAVPPRPGHAAPGDGLVK